MMLLLFIRLRAVVERHVMTTEREKEGGRSQQAGPGCHLPLIADADTVIVEMVA